MEAFLDDSSIPRTTQRSRTLRPLAAVQTWSAEQLHQVTHDLRNTLTVIQCNAKLLTYYAADTAPPIQAALNDRLAALSDAVLQLEAQLAQFDGPPIGQAIDIVALARRSAAAHQPAGQPDMIRVEAEPAQVIGFWDSVGLARVLDNLLVNAVKYSPNGDAIAVQISIERRGATMWARMLVCDHGIGIPPDAQSLIFRPRYRAANVPSTIPGSGLGLSSVRQIIAAAGGTVSVRSRMTSGTCFTIRLPLSQAGPAPASEGLC